MAIVERILKIKIILILVFFTYSFSQEKITLQLKWLHQFQFAGYYAAKEKGFYDEVGLDVNIKQRDIKFNNIEQVIDGEAEYGVADSVLLLYKTKNEPVVIVAPIFQHSPSVLISLKSRGINSPYDLNDKNIIFYENDTDGFAILGMLKKLNIKPNFIRKREAGDYLKLMNNEIDLIPAYLSNELFYFKERNIDLNVINPINYGFDLYGDMLFTNKNEATNHPERVEKFKKATLKGWEYALKNQEEIIQLIHNKYNNIKSIEHLRFEANVTKEMIDITTTALGTLDKGRLQYISQLYKDYGLINTNIDIKDFIFEEFKYNLNLTEEELNYIKNKKEITYCIDPNWMPFEKNIDSKHFGITADFFKKFQKEIGIPLKFIPTDTWSESLTFLKEKKCDLLSLVMSTEKEKEYLNFTKVYITSPLVIVTTNDKFFISNISDILDKRLGIVKGYSYIDILKKKYPNINIVEVEDIEDGLDRVKNEDIFGFIGALSPTAYEIQNKYTSQLKVSGKFDETWDLSIGTRIDEPLLNNIFNKAINTITFEERQLIFNKWISVKFDEGTNYKLVIEWVIGTVIIFGIILFVFVSANLKLNKEIKKRKKIEKRLKSFNTLIDEHIISSTTDLKGYITDVSSAFCEISKYSRDELIGQKQNIVRHPDMSSDFFEELWNTILSNNIWAGEIKNRAKDGTPYWVHTTISPKIDEFNNKIGYISIRYNITDKKIIEEISITDALTNIYNRRHFNEFFPKFINSAKRENQFISLLIMDVDFFKQYNDTYGHQMGDNTLIEVAKCLKESTFRSEDYCFRLGGEEFGLLFKSKNDKKAFEFASKILKNIEELKIEHKNSKVNRYITVSMGLYSCDSNEVTDIDDIYIKADKLLYNAKESGRNRIVNN